MRILVSEYLCSGALGRAAPPESLRREGLAMFRAIVQDLGQCLGVDLLAPVDPSLVHATSDWPANLTLYPVTGKAAEEEMLDRLAPQVDAALMIAPEIDNLLERRSRRFEELGVALLGPSSDAVRTAADKRKLAELWHQAGVPTPPCVDAGSAVDFPCVLKPRHGAGSQAAFLVGGQAELDQALDLAQAENVIDEFLLQPVVPGRSASVSILLGPCGRRVLPAAWQRLSSDGRLRYQGGELPLPPDLNDRAQRLAAQSIEVVLGLRGYVGVDLILGDASDGSDDRAIEINPRLTTSYVGLRALARFNLAAAWLGLLGLAGSIPQESWSSGPVSFGADGTVAGC